MWGCCCTSTAPPHAGLHLTQLTNPPTSDHRTHSTQHVDTISSLSVMHGTPAPTTPLSSPPPPNPHSHSPPPQNPTTHHTHPSTPPPPQDKRLADSLPTHKALLGTFTNTEVIRWTAFEAAYGPEVAAEAGPGGVFAGAGRARVRVCVCVFACAVEGSGKEARRAGYAMRCVRLCVLSRIFHGRLRYPLDPPATHPPTCIHPPHTPPHTPHTPKHAPLSDSKRSEDLKLRVVEHNVLVAAKYYR